MKRKVLILTTLMLGMCQGIPVYAAEPIAVAKAEEGVMPLYEHIRSISTVIDEKNGNVSCGVAVTLQESGKIEITMKLQRKTSTDGRHSKHGIVQKQGLNLITLKQKH